MISWRVPLGIGYVLLLVGLSVFWRDPAAPVAVPSEQRQVDELAKLFEPPTGRRLPPPCAPFEIILHLRGCPVVLQ